jgi:predicted glycosyltransferase
MLRFVDMVASHDVAESGLPLEVKRAIVKRLEAHGRVFATGEGALPEEFARLRFPLPADRLHDVLAFSDLLVGDSQTMAAEAAVLGTPNIRISSWAGRLAVLDELETRYGLSHSYRPADAVRALDRLDQYLAAPDTRASVAAAHRRLLAEKIDVADWLVRFIEAGAPTGGSAGRAAAHP